jgi:uncharacterized spore protein YtfJ
MSTKDMIESAVEHLRAGASVKTVYGEPVVVDGKTIIPVAKVAYGFGGGAAKAAPEGGAGETRQPGGEGETGGGAGGGAAAKPVGVVEISATETKFVPFAPSKRLAVAALIGSGVGLALGMFLGAKRN